MRRLGGPRSRPEDVWSSATSVPVRSSSKCGPRRWSLSEVYLSSRRSAVVHASMVFRHRTVRPAGRGHRRPVLAAQGLLLYSRHYDERCGLSRISDRAIFRRFRADGHAGRAGGLTIVALDVPGQHHAAAFSISKRVGPAVVRNRLRRQLRVALGQQARSGWLPPGAYLVVVRPAAAGAEVTTLTRWLRIATERAWANAESAI